MFCNSKCKSLLFYIKTKHTQLLKQTQVTRSRLKVMQLVPWLAQSYVTHLQQMCCHRLIETLMMMMMTLMTDKMLSIRVWHLGLWVGCVELRKHDCACVTSFPSGCQRKESCVSNVWNKRTVSVFKGGRHQHWRHIFLPSEPYYCRSVSQGRPGNVPVRRVRRGRVTYTIMTVRVCGKTQWIYHSRILCLSPCFQI